MTPAPPPALLRNIELKARCPDLPAAAAALATLDPPPRDAGAMRQIDTYFFCHRGRLKLREIVGVKAELIWYDRSDRAHSRASDYHLAPVTDPASLRVALMAGLGVRGTVTKHRHLLLWHNVRIHLDTVESLGSFIEFEAVMTAGESEPLAHERLAMLAQLLGIRPSDHCATSYAELLDLPR